MSDLSAAIVPIILSIITIIETLVLNFKFLNTSHYDDIYKISGIICAVSIGLIGIIIFDNGASLPSDSMPLHRPERKMRQKRIKNKLLNFI